MGPAEARVVAIDEFFPPACEPHPQGEVVLLVVLSLLAAVFVAFWFARWLMWFEKRDDRSERAAESAMLLDVFQRARQRGDVESMRAIEVVAAAKGFNVRRAFDESTKRTWGDLEVDPSDWERP